MIFLKKSCNHNIFFNSKGEGHPSLTSKYEDNVKSEISPTGVLEDKLILCNTT